MSGYCIHDLTGQTGWLWGAKYFENALVHGLLLWTGGVWQGCGWGAKGRATGGKCTLQPCVRFLHPEKLFLRNSGASQVSPDPSMTNQSQMWILFRVCVSTCVCMQITLIIFFLIPLLKASGGGQFTFITLSIQTEPQHFLKQFYIEG